MERERSDEAEGGQESPSPGVEEQGRGRSPDGFQQLGGDPMVDPGATDTGIGGTIGTDGWVPPGELEIEDPGS